MTNAPFLDLPVNGEIIDNSRRDQRPLAEFTPIIKAVLDDPTIVEFGWQQYAPHFNDGDACLFYVHHPIYFRTVADEEEEDNYNLTLDSDHSAIGRKGSTWDAVLRTYINQTYTGPDEARYDRCKALEDALEGGEFLDVLMNAFGDHAEVRAHKHGFDVDYCQHD